MKGRQTLCWSLKWLLNKKLTITRYPLSQNIFTSLHVFRLIDPSNAYPYTLTAPLRRSTNIQKVLRAYCLAVIKSCQLSLDCIQAQTFYEEEDFVTYLFGRELCPKMSSAEVLQLLSNSISLLDDHKIGKSQQDTEVDAALKQRLEIRDCLLRGLDRDANGEQTPIHWTRLRDQLGQLTASHALASAAPNAFSFKVQRQLASSTPPRPMPEISWQASLQKWMRLCDDIVSAHSVTSIEIVESPYRLKSEVWHFAYRLPAPTTYARAKLQELLTSDEKVSGDVSHFDLMLADIRMLVLPQDPLADPESFLVEATHDIRHRSSRVIEDFMMKAFGEYLNIHRMICQNRDRTRRLITQAIPIYDELEALAVESDGQIFDINTTRFTSMQRAEVYFPLWTWTRMHKLWLVQWAIQLGFETNLYQDHGLYEMYDALGAVFAQQERLTGTVVSAARTQAATEGKRSSARTKDLDQSLEWVSKLQRESHVNQSLALVLTFLWEFLSNLDLLPNVSLQPYYQEERRYEARMKPFLRAQHQVVPSLSALQSRKKDREVHSYSVMELQQYLEHIMGFSKEGSRIHSILENVKHLKTVVSGNGEQAEQQELKAIEATCWTVKITIAQLVSICKTHGKEHDPVDQYSLGSVVRVEMAEIKDRKHPWWVVPRIIEVGS